MGGYKAVKEDISLDAALDYSEIESLGEEMREWADGMSGTNLENTEKYSQVEECADVLEEQAQTLDDSMGRLRELLEDAGMKLMEIKLAVTFYHRKRGDSRSTRLSNALAAINRACEYLRPFIFQSDEKAQEVKEVLDEIEGASDELEAVDFPGMY